MVRSALIVGVLVASALYVAERLQGFDRAGLWQALAALTGLQISAALAAVLVAFIAVAGQERAVMAHLALSVPDGGRAAMAASAVSQTVGFGPVVGAIIRKRLAPDLTLGQSFAISAGITLGFFAGLGVLVLVCLAPRPGMGLAAVALGLVAVGLIGLALSPGGMMFGLRKPNLFVMGRFLGWLTLDLGALAVALWVVLPPGSVALAQILPVFLIGLGAGVASGSPGGVGLFEATLLTYLPQVGAGGMVAGLIAFRGLAYALPALCGALWALLGRSTRGPVAAVQPCHLTSEVLHALPSAEAQLVRQGMLTLMSDAAGGWVWPGGRLTHCLVMVGPVMNLPASFPPSLPHGAAMGGKAVPVGRMGRHAALQMIGQLARSEARTLCLYKVDARLAAVARRCGHAVLPVAREAVLNPATFTPAGPERARLRRKLAHARKAGIEVAPITALPLIEMEAVVADWAAVHGRERGFSMGRWDPAYVAGQRVIVARSASGVLLAFVTLHEGAQEWVLDLVRFRPGIPDGTTYAMLCCALDLARVAGVRRLSLAAVPVAAFGMTGLMGRIIGRATRRSIGLGQFKSAFTPKWETLYATAPSRAALVVAGLEVTRAILHPGRLHPVRWRFVVHKGGGGTKGTDEPQKHAA